MDFQVEEGTIHGFLGPNGAGKTTTIRVLMGLMEPTGGSASIFGRRVKTGDPASRVNVGYMPELPTFPGHLTAVEMMEIYGRFYGLSKGAIEPRTEELLNLVDLWEWRGKRIENYSKGMQQRLGVAQSLLSDPKLVIMDEPTAGLDPKGRVEVRDIIREIGGGDVTVFLSSHLLDEVERICGHVTIINRGRKMASGSIEEISERFSERKRIKVEVSELTEDLMSSLEDIPEVVEVSREGSEITILSELKGDIRGEVSDTIVKSGGKILAMNEEKQSLEDMFLKITEEEESIDE